MKRYFNENNIKKIFYFFLILHEIGHILSDDVTFKAYNYKDDFDYWSRGKKENGRNNIKNL